MELTAAVELPLLVVASVHLTELVGPSTPTVGAMVGKQNHSSRGRLRKVFLESGERWVDSVEVLQAVIAVVGVEATGVVLAPSLRLESQ